MTDTPSATNKCGSCGCKLTQDNRRSDYNTLCANCRVPHQAVISFPSGDGTFETNSTGQKLWKCTYCEAEGSWDDLQATDCAHRYEPCPSCKEHPYCALDCVAIAAALTGDGVYLAGFQPT